MKIIEINGMTIQTTGKGCVCIHNGKIIVDGKTYGRIDDLQVDIKGEIEDINIVGHTVKTGWTNGNRRSIILSPILPTLEQMQR